VADNPCFDCCCEAQEPGEKCCPGPCPEPGAICCLPDLCCGRNDEAAVCCEEGETCCGPEGGRFCCAVGEKCCQDTEEQYCCLEDETCCEGVCCPPGECCVDGECVPGCESDEDCPTVYLVCYGCGDIDDFEAYNAPCKEQFFSGPNAEAESLQYQEEECLSLVLYTTGTRCCPTEAGCTECGSTCGDILARCTECDIATETTSFLGPYDTEAAASAAGLAAADECDGAVQAVRLCSGLNAKYFVEVCCPQDAPP
jgi:hypothetical protein